jgi:hypothetical protein
MLVGKFRIGAAVVGRREFRKEGDPDAHVNGRSDGGSSLQIRESRHATRGVPLMHAGSAERMIWSQIGAN